MIGLKDECLREDMSVMYFLAQSISARIAIVKVRKGHMGHAFTIKIVAPQMQQIIKDVKITLLGAE